MSKKADALFPVVSAASICAKVSRDKAVNNWQFKENIDISGDGWGSGYPAGKNLSLISVCKNYNFGQFTDPATKKFLKENLDSVFGFPQLVRFSWSTAEKIIDENCVTMEW